MNTSLNLTEISETNNIQFGYLQPIDSGIVNIIQLLAQDPAYAGIPFERVQEIIQTILEKRYFAAVHAETCIGVVLYVHISCDTARNCIIEKRQPYKEEIDPKGQDIFMTAITGKHVKQLTRTFIRRCQGRLILYERHNLMNNGKFSKDFCWIDRSGVIRGESGFSRL